MTHTIMEKIHTIYQSPSGYAMPFEVDEGKLKIIFKYGRQTDNGGEEFFNHGIDFQVPQGTWLKALGTGVVTGISSDQRNGFAITINYPNYGDGRRSSYDVVYSRISESLINFGRNVRAGDNVARCGNRLHIEVRFNGDEIDPGSFLTMLYDNCLVTKQLGDFGDNPEIATLDFDVRTPYDNQKQEIDQLMSRYFDGYMDDVLLGRYLVPRETEYGLREAFLQIQVEGLLEHLPSLLNPRGLGRRAISLMETVQTLLATDFLNYLALKEHVFLSSMSEAEKKKLLTGH